jgi:hypothetical protein
MKQLTKYFNFKALFVYLCVLVILGLLFLRLAENHTPEIVGDLVIQNGTNCSIVKILGKPQFSNENTSTLIAYHHSVAMSCGSHTFWNDKHQITTENTGQGKIFFVNYHGHKDSLSFQNQYIIYYLTEDTSRYPDQDIG